jgi:hypothetical protein
MNVELDYVAEDRGIVVRFPGRASGNLPAFWTMGTWGEGGKVTLDCCCRGATPPHASPWPIVRLSEREQGMLIFAQRHSVSTVQIIFLTVKITQI